MKENKDPKFSVIIATYNRLNQLKNAIGSVLAQSYPNFEIAVVNDYGQNASKIVEEFKDDRIKYLSHDVNKGLGAARNTGIKNTDGDYIVCLDDDDVFFFNHLEMLGRVLVNTDFEIVYTDAVRSVQEKQKNGSYKLLGRDIPYSLDYNEDLILVQNITPVLCVGFARKCIEEVGYFNETYRAYEDYDLWVRISRKYPMHHIPIPTCEFTWRMDGSTMSSSRNDFTTLLPELFTEYRKYAKNIVWVTNAQNQILRARGLKEIL